MNKKFLSAILFGALMVTSTGTFVSCKDYDDDIDAINSELTDIKSQLAALQAKVDAGKWITSATSTAEGVTITLSDGSTLKITNGKDGAQGAAGQNGADGKDGKNGTVVTVNENGVLCLDGVETAIKVAEEAPAALPCVKVENGELMILQADGTYAASGIKAGSVTAAKVNGMWTITVDGETITVPGSAALTSIAIENGTDFKYYYGVVSKAVEWGWNKEETMEAGFYSKLDRDLVVLLNPAEADGTAFNYTFKNSLNEAADVTFFDEARPSTAVLTRAASANGLWTLPAAVTKKDAASIESLRRELYLNFKENDGKAYAMTLEAADGMGEVAVRSGYDYKIELAKAVNSVDIEDDHMYCLIGQEYYPTILGDAYDYKIRLVQTAENLRWAKVFGIKLTEDEKGFYAENESAVYNDIKFQVAYVTIGGEPGTTSFTVSFTNEMATAEAMQVAALETPFDATLVAGTDKVFALSYTYDLSEQVAKLSDDAKLLWDQALEDKTYEVELIGGEAADAGENYNALNRNKKLLKNISWDINSRNAAKNANVFGATFYVSNTWEKPSDYSETMDWVAYSNFQLNTAYQLNIKVKDPLNEGVVVAEIEFPFEFAQPTLDITQDVDGEFTQWGTTPILKYTDAQVPYVANERALLVYGVKGESNQNMYLPLYDSFTAWKLKGQGGATANFQKYVDNAEYYNLRFLGYEPARILSEETQDAGKEYIYPLDNKLDYSARFENLNTWALYAKVNAAATNSTVNTTVKTINGVATAVAEPYELSTPIEVCYKHYGVYEAFDHSKYVDGKVNGADFHLVFASWLKHSTLAMAEDVYSTERGNHTLFITNDDLNFKTPKGDAFYLFDGLTAAGKKLERADLNGAFNEVEQHPFTTVADLYDVANFKAVEADGAQAEIEVQMGAAVSDTNFELDAQTGEVTLLPETFTADASKITIYNIPSYAKVNNSAVQTGVQKAFQGGMLIQLPKSVQDGQNVILTITLTDSYGYTKDLKIEIAKLK